VRDDRERLADIFDAIAKIEKYAVQGKEVFERDELIQTWIVHYLEIIGESSRSLSPQFRSRHADRPWSQIVAMRNILIHHYFGIDKEAVWSAVERDLPELKRHVEAILRELTP
jgi:uncharacterized protein with HEPN domain